MNRYSELIAKLYSVNIAKGMKLGLENVLKLNQLLGNPASAFRSVHVAGTNGKGSVVTKVAKGLENKYSQVGLYTSPHISTFRERITINREMISEQDIERLLPPIFELANRLDIPATFFELTTLLALKYFAEKNVDFAVIETGLGGRQDATNILVPALSIITSIDYDHTDLLGYSLESIALEKAGIIKHGVPVILGPSADIIPIKEGCKAIIIKENFSNVESENRAIAHAALKHLNIPETAIKKALTTKLSCRRERINFQEKEVILDVAHNRAGLERLFQDLAIPKEKLRVVFALSKTKDIKSCLNILHLKAKSIHLIDSPNGRCAAPVFLKDVLLAQGVDHNRLTLHDSIAHCMSSAFSKAAEEKQELLVCGTFFIMSEVRKFLGIDEPRDPIDLNERFKI
jgi:dihydrofolate synthase/folylpolyglutamate synthase